MPVLEVHPGDQVLVATGDTPLLDIYDALPAGLYPPFPPLELPGGLGGLLQRGGFGQNFFFPAEILGVTFTAPSGRRVVAGGRTVKNVQGYDLTRLFVGSFGHLGTAQTVTLRLRPGLTVRHVARPGELGDGPGTRARFVWQEGGRVHRMHFGHAHEVEAVLGGEEGQDTPGRSDLRGLFPQGMGVGEGGPLRDRRFGWVDGIVTPTPPRLFARVAAAL